MDDPIPGRKVFSRGPLRSPYFLMGTLFQTVVSLPVVWILTRHGNRFSTEASLWLFLGVAASWLFWVRVGISHARLHKYAMGEDVGSHPEFLLSQGLQLAYGGLFFLGSATFCLLNALWLVAGAR